MRRSIALATVAAVGVTITAGTAAATSGGRNPARERPTRPAAEHVPASVDRVELTKRDGNPSQAVKHGTIAGRQAHRLVRAFNDLKRPFPDAIYDCGIDHGRREIARYRADGHVWIAIVGKECGLVSVTRDGHRLPSLADSQRYDTALSRDFRTIRPSSERVPRSVHKARLTYRKEPSQPVSRRRTVTGDTADALVKAFDRLKAEPQHYVTCQIAGGPTQTVTFPTPKHTWVAIESPCTQVHVTRDGKSQPTLLPNADWDRAVAAGLGTVHRGHHGHARAVAEAKALLADAPTIASAAPSDAAPVKRLRHAPERASYVQLVVRARWWTAQESTKAAYRDLTADRRKGYQETGRGVGYGPHPHDASYSVDYQPKTTPARIAYAQLLIAVTPTGKNTAAIGAYGQAVPRPHRPGSEYVPASVHKALVLRVRGVTDKHPRQRNLHGRLARDLVRDFDALRASAPSISSCGEDHGQSDSVSFRAHGNVWVASTGACPGVAVVRDGKALPTLDDSKAFHHDLNVALRPR